MALVQKINEISYLSDYENAELIASLEVSNNETYQCSKCQDNSSNRVNYEAHMANVRKVKGCYEPSKTMKFAYENIKFKKCPANFLNRAVFDLIGMYLNYEKGLLPYKGTISEQPYKIIEIFNKIENYRNRQVESRKN